MDRVATVRMKLDYSDLLANSKKMSTSQADALNGMVVDTQKAMAKIQGTLYSHQQKMKAMAASGDLAGMMGLVPKQEFLEKQLVGQRELLNNAREAEAAEMARMDAARLTEREGAAHAELQIQTEAWQMREQMMRRELQIEAAAWREYWTRMHTEAIAMDKQMFPTAKGGGGMFGGAAIPGMPGGIGARRMYRSMAGFMAAQAIGGMPGIGQEVGLAVGAFLYMEGPMASAMAALVGVGAVLRANRERTEALRKAQEDYTASVLESGKAWAQFGQQPNSALGRTASGIAESSRAATMKTGEQLDQQIKSIGMFDVPVMVWQEVWRNLTSGVPGGGMKSDVEIAQQFLQAQQNIQSDDTMAAQKLARERRSVEVTRAATDQRLAMNRLEHEGLAGAEGKRLVLEDSITEAMKNRQHAQEDERVGVEARIARAQHESAVLDKLAKDMSLTKEARAKADFARGLSWEAEQEAVRDRVAMEQRQPKELENDAERFAKKRINLENSIADEKRQTQYKYEDEEVAGANRVAELKIKIATFGEGQKNALLDEGIRKENERWAIEVSHNLDERAAHAERASELEEELDSQRKKHQVNIDELNLQRQLNDVETQRAALRQAAAWDPAAAKELQAQMMRDLENVDPRIRDVIKAHMENPFIEQNKQDQMNLEILQKQEEFRVKDEEMLREQMPLESEPRRKQLAGLMVGRQMRDELRKRDEENARKAAPAASDEVIEERVLQLEAMRDQQQKMRETAFEESVLGERERPMKTGSFAAGYSSSYINFAALGAGRDSVLGEAKTQTGLLERIKDLLDKALVN